jgi:hypothetical protein
MIGQPFAVLVCLALCSADTDPEKEKQNEALRELMLKNMTHSAAQHVLKLADEPKRAFKLNEKPVMRHSNPVGSVKDGAVFIWTDGGRPQALLKMYTFGDADRFTHEWLSLSESAFTAQRDGRMVWEPSEPGITYRELPEAPKAGESPNERLRQMKALVPRFDASYVARHLDPKPFVLRLLPQPIFRVEPSANKKWQDGAIFTLVQDGDPVGLILFETREIKGELKWYYAFASMVTGSVTAKYGDKEIFSLERDHRMRDPKMPYLQLHGIPVPKE